MKKGVSISLVLLLLTAMLNISVATHYCGGKVAASKVSLTGKLANCGMEGTGRELPLSGTYFTKHCCEDVVTSYGTDSNYSPSVFNVKDTYQDNFQIFGITTGTPAHSIAVLESLSNNGSPPGLVLSTHVDLSYICVFRI